MKGTVNAIMVETLGKQPFSSSPPLAAKKKIEAKQVNIDVAFHCWRWLLVRKGMKFAAELTASSRLASRGGKSTEKIVIE